MPDQSQIRGELVAYLMGALDPAEDARFETLLAADPRLRDELGGLSPTVAMVAAAAPLVDVPAGLGEWIHVAVRDVASAEPRSANGVVKADPERVARVEPTSGTQSRHRAGFRWWSPQRFAMAGGALAALALAVFAGNQIGTRGSDGELEVSGDLRTPDGVVAGTVDVRALGIGRAIEIDSDAFPILPKGEFYEVWFVGPGDEPSNPNRISAGTFHPDSNGRSNLELKAAVDPALFEAIEITAEPGDGDPSPSDVVAAGLELN